MVAVFCVAVAVVHVVNVVAVLNSFVTAVRAVGVFFLGVVRFAVCSHDAVLFCCARSVRVFCLRRMCPASCSQFLQIYKRIAIY